MDKRPLCVLLGIVTVMILLFRVELRISSAGEQYRGEHMRLACQVEEICGQGDAISLIVSDVTEEDGSLLCARMKAYQTAGSECFSGLVIGNLIILEGELYSFDSPGNPGQFDERSYYEDQGISYRFFVQSAAVTSDSCRVFDQWLHEVRESVFEKIMSCLPEEEGGVAAAMLLGEKSALTDEVKQLYQENGIAHILAISGLHISFIGAGIFFLLRRFVMPMRPAAVVSSALLLAYGEFTGFSVSAQRAVWMMICLLMARFLGRRYDLYCAIALSALVSLCIHPLLLFQSGFLLSYGTVLGIGLFVRKFQGMTAGAGRDGSVSALILNALRGSLGIQLVTLPILLYYYYEFNPYSVLVNLLVLPLVSVVLVMSAAGSALAFASGSMGEFLFGSVHYILMLYHQVTTVVPKLPCAAIITGRPSGVRILLYYVLLLLWVYFFGYPSGRRGKGLRERRKKKMGRGSLRAIRAGLLVMAVLLLLFPLPPGTELTITTLDVGQGDCTCIRQGGRTILIDGGSSDVGQVGKYRISKYLKYCGIQKIDYIFLTHSDSDHVNGIMEIIQEDDHMGFDIGAVVFPDLTKADENCQTLEETCRECGVTVKKMSRGDSIHIGELELSCLHPYLGYEWDTENDYSLVLSLTYRDFHGLFTGDLEQAGEREILTAEGSMAEGIRDVDYLKVGHHGSSGSSSSEFLEAAAPRAAVVSAGEDNRYGHPAADTIERLRNAGAGIYSTIDSGAVVLYTDGKESSVSTFK